MSAKDNAPEGDDLDAARKIAMATMGPEEIEAMKQDELSEEERKRLEAIAKSGEDDDDEDDEDEDGDGEGEGGKPAAAAAEDAAIPTGDGVSDQEPTDTVGDDDAPTFRAKYKVDLPEDYDDQVAALDTADADLLKKFKDGDVEVDEYLAEQRKIADQRSTLRSLKDRADTFQAMNEQAAAQEWQDTVDRFISKAKKDEGVDYRGKGNERLMSDFDTFVKTLAGREENANKPYTWFLAEAHRATKALHGIGKPATKGEKGEKKADGKPSRKPPTDSIPASVAGVPGSEGPGDVDGDEFADLDKLEGLEYEKALAKLTPEQRDRYRALA